MPWKKDENGNLVVENGNPVWVYVDGKGEAPLDAQSMLDKIGDLNNEAAQRRREVRTLEEKLKPLDGIDDLATWRKEADKARATMKNLDDKQLIDAGEVEKVKAGLLQAHEQKVSELQRSYEQQVGELRQKLTDVSQALNTTNVGGAFARSKFIQEHLAIPADMVEAKFGQHFKYEGGQVVGYDGDVRIMSRKSPGNAADFEEALHILVDKYPHKDSILRSSGADGSGAGAVTGRTPAGAVTIKEEIARKDPAAYRAAAAQAAERGVPLIMQD